MDRLERLSRLWANQPLAVKGVVVVALPLVVLLVAVVSLYLASLAEAQAEDDVRATFAIQNDIHEVHALLAEAAGGMRGYLLTGQARFLEPYIKAEAEMPRTLARLRGSVRDAEIEDRLDRVETLVEQKRRGLALLQDLREQGASVTDNAELAAALASNKGVLDQLRSEIELMQVRENALLDDRRRRADEARSRNLSLTAISGAIGLLGSLAAVSLFSSGIVRRIHLLQQNANRLGRGEPLEPLPADADEIGRLAVRLEQASDLLRAREQALREGEERFRMVVEGVRDYGIFALDVDGHVTSWNVGAERIKGWTADEIIGRRFSCFYPEDTRDTVPARMLEEAEQSGRVEDEGWRVRKSGERFWANVVITALRDDQGQLKGFSKVTRDISDRRRTEQDLRVAREEAEAASQAKSEFLSRMSHELRTPLNAILGFAQLVELDETEIKPAHARSNRQIIKAGRHLLGLIDEMLDIARIEAGRLELSLEFANLADVVREAADLTQPIAQARSIVLRIGVQGDETPVAFCDRRRVVQVLLNLLSNAVKYNRPHGSVDVVVTPANGQILVTVSDEGCGVDPADETRLFKPFERLGHSRARAVEGTGLGLALSRRLVEAMDGEIGYRPTGSGGSTFWFSLPSSGCEAVLADAGADHVETVVNSRANGHRPPVKILYVEDNLSNIQLVEGLIRRRHPDCQLLTAMQGRIGLELAHRHQPDLVLLDLHLPDMTGEAVLASLQRQPDVPPVIVISADAIKAVETRIIDAGAAAFLTKPVDVRAFLDEVDRQLGSRAKGVA